MKNFYLLLALLPLTVKAQWYDNFSDGDFTKNPSWYGDSSKFIVTKSAQLQLNAPAATGTAYLGTTSTVAHKATWSFSLNMGFNPSSGNYAKVFLMADQPDLTASVNGYCVRIGSSTDDICLFKREGTSETLLIDGRDGMLDMSAVNVRIKVTRDDLGTWELLCDTTGGTNYISLGKNQEDKIYTSNYLIIQCIYTSTRSTKFYFDDFNVEGEKYIPPVIPTPKDSSRLFDVLFNELMVDPSPVAGLPEVEYLELYNRSKRNISLKDWKLTVGSNIYIFPPSEIIADGYLLLTSKTDTPNISVYGPTLGLFSSTTTLNNTGQYLKLENADGRLISWIEYDDTWYGDSYKAQGGWALEQIDPFNPCGGKLNWTASRNRSGGTPGSKNSVDALNQDVTLPDLLHINIPCDSVIDLYFTEPLDTAQAFNSEKYTIAPDGNHPKRLLLLNNTFTSIRLLLPFKLRYDKVYNLDISRNITDCSGNPLAQDLSIPFSVPVEPDSGDIVINEVLFNAYAGGTDYIEIYNRSGKTFNSRQILIGAKASDGSINDLCRLSETGSLIPPHSYWLLAYEKEKVRMFYTLENEKNTLELKCMPSLDDKVSTIVLQNDAFRTLDIFSYSDKMHLSTLRNTEGISLERLNPEKPSYFPGNWHSAAESYGFGTPGYQNSQYLSDSVFVNEITIEHELFSPDNDGYKDVLQVSYNFGKPACRAQVYIFDCSGRLIRRLLNNELLGTEGSFSWDGMNEAGKRCEVGMYTLFIRIVSDDGAVKEYKKSCVLAIKR